MSENSKIEWCDHTFNPWIGCTKVSPGCAHCYAELSTRARVLRAGGQETWGKGAQRSRTTSTWGDPVKWNREAAGEALKYEIDFDQQLRRGEQPVYAPPRRPRVFCASLADWLDDEVPIEWLVDLLELIRNTPQLDWLLLTKRPANWKTRIGLAARHVREHGGDMGLFCAWGHGEAPENIWIGTTVEDQQRADERIPILLSIPAKVRFLSCEPLLGPVNITEIVHRNDPLFDPDNRPILNAFNSLVHHEHTCITGPSTEGTADGVHWVIAGGESGSNARPMQPEWARSLRDQCQEAKVPFLFKQWGEHAPYFNVGMGIVRATPEARASILSGEWIGSTDEVMVRTPKKSAGRLLDGREWNEFPTGKAGA